MSFQEGSMIDMLKAKTKKWTRNEMGWVCAGLLGCINALGKSELTFLQLSYVKRNEIYGQPLHALIDDVLGRLQKCYTLS